MVGDRKKVELIIINQEFKMELTVLPQWWFPYSFNTWPTLSSSKSYLVHQQFSIFLHVDFLSMSFFIISSDNLVFNLFSLRLIKKLSRIRSPKKAIINRMLMRLFFKIKLRHFLPLILYLYKYHHQIRNYPYLFLKILRLLWSEYPNINLSKKKRIRYV